VEHKSKIKIMLLVNQPWEAQFLAEIGKNLLRFNPDNELVMVFADYYTFLLRQDFLTGLSAGFSGRIVTQRDVYSNWQTQNEDPEVDFEYLQNWESKYCKTRTLSEIEETNQWVYGAERSQWYAPISDLWKKKILEDSIRWCERVFEEYKPDAFLAINNSTLPITLFDLLGKSHKIPFWVFLPSRIGERWILVNDFGYGMSEILYEQILGEYESDESLKLAKEFLVEFNNKRTGSYSSTAATLVSEFEFKRQRKFLELRKDLRRLAGRVYGRIFIQPKEKSLPVRRITEDFLRMSLVEFRGILVFHMRLHGLKLFGRTTVPTERYFLWGLHYRPEGSVLTLGDARDEIEELVKCADALPDGFFLAVKENPDMIGIRAKHFYSKLKKHQRIILVDPYVSSIDLIEKSIGVIGISGTILLEAAMRDKPSCALGHPEFDRFLCASGWSSAKDFFKKSIDGVYESPFTRILPYIAHVLEESNEFNIHYGADLTSTKAKDSATRFAERFYSELQP
jgi:hypothetical protein